MAVDIIARGLAISAKQEISKYSNPIFVNSLPSASSADKTAIYFVGPKGSEPNVYYEKWIVSGDGSSAEWKNIGSTSVDFSDYYKKSEVDSKLSEKANSSVKINGHDLKSDVNLTKSDIGLDNVGNYKSVSVENGQNLTDAEKTAARENIEASKVEVAKDGTSIDEIKYITVDGVEHKIAGTEPEPKTFDKISKIKDYLYSIDYDASGVDYDYAYKYFKNETLGSEDAMACSSARNDNWFGRNYDWTYNENATFVIRVNGAKHKSIGVALKSGLTNSIAETHKDDEKYRILPFFTLDGINDNGVFVSANVVPLDYEPTSPDDVEGKVNLSAIMLPRYVLDNFGSADEAVNFIKNDAHISMPKSLQDMHYEMHFMVGDKNKTFIVEIINNEVVIKQSEKPILTNFYVNNVAFNADGTVYTPATQDATHNAVITNGITEFGSGLERYNLINNNYVNTNSLDGMRSMMIDVFATNTYKKQIGNDFWYTEFVGEPVQSGGAELLKVNTQTVDFNSAANIAKNRYNNRSRDPESEYYGTWQTVHSAVYDVEKKTVYIVSQEDINDNYKFNINEYYDSIEVDALLEKKQNVINNDNKILSDCVDDSEQNNKFVTEEEKEAWNAKSDVSASKTGSSVNEINYITIDGNEYKIAGAGAGNVNSVNGKTGNVVLAAGDIEDSEGNTIQKDIDDIKDGKQDKLIAGENINIVGNVISSICNSTMGRSFVTNVTVGNLASGSEINATDTISDILYRILFGDTPAKTVELYYGASTDIPTGINGLTKVEKEAEWLKNNEFVQTIKTGDPSGPYMQYTCVACSDKFKLSDWMNTATRISYMEAVKSLKVGNYNIYYREPPIYDEDLGGESNTFKFVEV